MTTKKPPLPAKKKSPGFAASILDATGWLVREAALPVPDSLMDAMKNKKKTKDRKKKK